MSTITLGQFLFQRLKQVQVTTVFGLPGDFNLSLLDHIYEVEGMKWAGDTNELNAAYAADGYARVKGLGAIITTFGVGELSALNGIAGAYAEHVGVIHIVGVASTASQSKQLLLHHTLGNGDFTVFHRMSSSISNTTAWIDDIAKAPAEIDRCIRAAYIHQKPVYIGFPTNFVEERVDISLLDTPIDLFLQPNDPGAQAEVIETLCEMIEMAENPVILVDACASRHGVKEETAAFIDVTQFPAFVTPMGKGVVDEQNPRFGGVYVGNLSKPNVKKAVESADLILSIGAILSDFNTGSFSYSYQTRNVVEFHSDYIRIKSAIYQDVGFKFVLQELVKHVSTHLKNYTPVPVPEKSSPVKAEPLDKLTQSWLWTNLSNWLQEGDIVISETGTSAFGIVETTYQTNTLGISQVLWGSIGYSVGACAGAVAASQELDPDRRVILFVGDGSLQLTVQAISTMVRHKLKPYLFVLNNNGYTIEKLIHGECAGYNSIQPWNHLKLLPTFGAREYEALQVTTVGDLDTLFRCADFAKNDKIRLIELMLDAMDAPPNLVKQAQMTANVNSSS
jgi:pyruvate decarboxylase